MSEGWIIGSGMGGALPKPPFADTIWWAGRNWGSKSKARVFASKEEAESEAIALVLRGVSNAKAVRVF